ncbi:LysR family transcriptional regulator [Amphibiibacter pelophylacis]|uniref:LysR family transcriptional regulator n=1 Tax=Amphibiibacter pelophylacis TaxID=1799477 RepID=A0ACC6P0L6_9BURK
MNPPFNYRHLYYFWVMAHEGSLTRAAQRLDMAVQTISAQVRELEKQLGHALLKPQGRKLVLTEAGMAALREADRIFEVGQSLPDVVREAASSQVQRLAIGISDGVPKLAVHRLLQPVLDAPHLRLLCNEGEYEQLWAELVLHKLDAVISDRAAPTEAALPLRSVLLASPALAWYGAPERLRELDQPFPQALHGQPVLLPSVHSAMRAQIEHWLEREHVKPRIVAEFEDMALMTTFGAAGMGLFPAAEWLDPYLRGRLGLAHLATCTELQEQYHLIYAPRKVMHPLVERLMVPQAADEAR